MCTYIVTWTFIFVGMYIYKRTWAILRNTIYETYTNTINIVHCGKIYTNNNLLWY